MLGKGLVTIVIVLVIGYAVGAMYPQAFNVIKAKAASAAG